MSALWKLGREGHGMVAEWSGEDAASQKVAAAEFEALQAKGYTMFDTSGLVSHKLEKFDPAVGMMLAVPRMVGG